MHLSAAKQNFRDEVSPFVGIAIRMIQSILGCAILDLVKRLHIKDAALESSRFTTFPPCPSL
jgi:hypothetical protein